MGNRCFVKDNILVNTQSKNSMENDSGTLVFVFRSYDSGNTCYSIRLWRGNIPLYRFHTEYGFVVILLDS